MKKLIVWIVCAGLWMSACGQNAEPTIIIFPDQCTVSAGKQLPISLKGTNMPAGAVIKWSATSGKLEPTTGLSVMYTAPKEPGSVIINAVMEADGKQFSAVLTCEVAEEQIITEAPPTVPTEQPIQETEAPTPIPPHLLGDTIAITEVMPYPCGFTDALPSINEYIELYNYGVEEVNVNGWWIGTTGGGQGTPDQLVTWNAVNPRVDLGLDLQLNNTIIPPGGYAIVISPIYHTGLGNYRMPYAFPKDTTILTFATSEYVGNDSKGLAASYHPLTTIVLYKGSKNNMSTVVSTYGTPTYGSPPETIKDDKADNLPYFIPECHVMERIDPAKADSLSNWRETTASPGSGY